MKKNIGFIFSILFLTSLNILLAAESTNTDKIPNRTVIFVIFDTLRYDHCSLNYKSSRDITPFLKRLASEGLNFTRAVSPNTWTFPAHASIFTGLTTFQLQVDYGQENFCRLPQSYFTLAEILTEQGVYTLQLADNVYLNPLGSHFEVPNLSQGWKFSENFYDIKKKSTMVIHENGKVDICDNLREFAGAKPLDNFPSRNWLKVSHYLANINLRDEIWPKIPDVMPYVYNRYKFTLHKLDQIKQKKLPLFLFINLHTIFEENYYTLHQKWLQQYLRKNAGIEIPIEELDYLETSLAKYRFEVPLEHYILLYDYYFSFQAKVLESLFAILKQKGILNDKAYVIVSSDHGLLFEEHGSKREGHDASMPWEELLHVPLVIKGPGLKQQVIEDRVNTIDIFATILDIFSISPYVYVGKNFIGKSLLKRVEENNFDDYIVIESVIDRNNVERELSRRLNRKYTEVFTLYHKNFKLIYGLDSPVAFLFDLEKDPLEADNLFFKEKKICHRMLEKLNQYLLMQYGQKISNHKLSDLKKEDVDLHPVIKENLRSLGYIH